MSGIKEFLFGHKKSSDGRYYPFDLARGICVLWIVGFWHMQYYLSPAYKLGEVVLPICRNITTGVLACFTFLSGYFLKKYVFQSWSDVGIFYKKRFFRFYPLFVVGAFSMIVCGSTIKQVLLAIAGLSMFSTSPIQTLWFFSMLILFYMMTPWLKYQKGELRTNITFIIMVLVVLIGGYFFADERLELYFPFYVLGLNMSNNTVDRVLNTYSLCVAVVVFSGLCFLGYDCILIQWCFGVTGTLAILVLSKFIFTDRIAAPVLFVSEASMCAYLYHRPFYSCIVGLLRKTTTFYYLPIPLAVTSLIFLFIFAFIIQTLYKRLITKLT